MSRYLTKSRFKLALECETKLYFTKKESEYADQSLDDEFLKNLAEGGFQVGELAKYYFCNDPVASDITVDTLDNEGALQETNEKITNGEITIAEAAFRYNNLFIRTDIIRIWPENRKIELVEVKAKSHSSEDLFYTVDKSTGVIKDIKSDWKPYLMDIAFQKYVLAKCYPDYQINAFLMMANKDSKASVEGLNQYFKINKSGDKVKVDVSEGLTREMLGDEILVRIPVDREVSWLWEHPVNTGIADNITFEEYIELLSSKYDRDQKIKSPIGSKCKRCQFRTTKEQDEKGALRSGFRECWKEHTGIPEKELVASPLVTELWCGGFTGLQKIIEAGTYKLQDITEEHISPKSKSKTEYSGLSPLNRRMIQIEKTKNHDTSVFLDKEGLKQEMDRWNYPLHFIDFETSRVAIPFHAGKRPYEQIAFQFSHHAVDVNSSITHAGQYISFTPGEFPNYDFLRALMRELGNDDGTIFRYHNHENTVLCEIYDQLEKEENPVQDKEELMTFIRSITCKKDHWMGERNMVDLYKLVTGYYYPPAAGGSNSLKYILPATIQSSEFLKNKYIQPVYGTSSMPSLNFSRKIWLPDANDFNPYHALPAVFERYSLDQLDSLMVGFDEVAEGGAAMTAYAKLQFSVVPGDQRVFLRDALLKYCELDTLAMVMIWEFWMNELKNA